MSELIQEVRAAARLLEFLQAPLGLLAQLGGGRHGLPGRGPAGVLSCPDSAMAVPRSEVALFRET
ncbi:hypothetical protein [Streptomyces sp. NPDC002671]